MAKSDDDEETRGGRVASHARGGGHSAPQMSRAAVKGANIARGANPVSRASFVARQAANAGSWETPSVLIEEDDDMTHPLYQGMKFKDYEYNEFPKAIGDKLAMNEDEEKVILAGRPLLREPEERVRLIAVAEVKGVTIDKRWNIEKIVKAIEDAGYDPTLDPSK
jgi:hypothetical protein